MPLGAWSVWWLWHGYYSWVQALSPRPASDGPLTAIHNALVWGHRLLPAAMLAALIFAAGVWVIAYRISVLRAVQNHDAQR